MSDRTDNYVSRQEDGHASDISTVSDSGRDHARILDIDGIYNVRDLGGLHTADGKTVSYGKIIRGSEMDGEHGIRITKAGISSLRDDAGICFDLDLRSDSETDMIMSSSNSHSASTDTSTGNTPSVPITSSPLGKNTGYVRIPLKAYLKPWLTMTSQSGRIKEQTYYAIAFRVIFDCVKENTPVYIHCWAGADRTGTICFLLEGLLGVSEADIGKDYEMTSLSGKFGTRSVNSEDYRTMLEYIGNLDGSSEISRSDFEEFFRRMGFTGRQMEDFRAGMLSGAGTEAGSV